MCPTCTRRPTSTTQLRTVTKPARGCSTMPQSTLRTPAPRWCATPIHVHLQPTTRPTHQISAGTQPISPHNSLAEPCPCKIHHEWPSVRSSHRPIPRHRGTPVRTHLWRKSRSKNRQPAHHKNMTDGLPAPCTIAQAHLPRSRCSLPHGCTSSSAILAHNG